MSELTNSLPNGACEHLDHNWHSHDTKRPVLIDRTGHQSLLDLIFCCLRYRFSLYFYRYSPSHQLESPAPVFYRRAAAGPGLVIFMIYKFRTSLHRENYCKAAGHRKRPAFTRVVISCGKPIGKLHTVHVFRGEMSILVRGRKSPEFRSTTGKGIPF